MLSQEALTFYGHNRTEYPVTALLETTGPDPLKDQLLGVQFLGQQDSAIYCDLSPEASDLDKETARGMLRAYPLIMFGAARCCTWLGRAGVLPTVAADPLLMAFVLDPNQPLDLQTLSAKYLDRPLQTLSSEPLEAGIIQRLSGELLRDPFEPMAIAIRDLHEKLRAFPDWTGEADLEPILDQELALVPVIAKMEIAGILVDSAKLASIASDLVRTSVDLEAKLAALSARPK